MSIDLAGLEVLVETPDPIFDVEPPSGVAVAVESPLFDLLVESPAAPMFEVDPPAPADVILVPVEGKPGPPGSSVQEVFVQQTEPTHGATPWFLAQTDVDGDVEFLKVYEP